jgi:hypothetical protein
MKPNPAVAIPSIMSSKDKGWLTGFRARIHDAGVREQDAVILKIVDAIDTRLSQLGDISLRTAISKPLGDMTLVERVQEAVRVYEEFLAYKHGGKRISASRTKQMIKRWGEKEAVRRTVTNMDMSNGLDLLAKYDRLDCAYEQIILDFALEFDQAASAKARKNLAGLRTEGDESFNA